MSNPSFSNIDRWFFDYVEGNLSQEQVTKFEAFIAKHPELEFDLNNWKSSKLQPIDIEYPDVDSLYKTEKIRTTSLYWLTSMSVSVFVVSFLIYALNFNSGAENSILAENNDILTSLDQKHLEINTSFSDISTIKSKENGSFNAISPILNNSIESRVDQGENPVSLVYEKKINNQQTKKDFIAFNKGVDYSVNNVSANNVSANNVSANNVISSLSSLKALELDFIDDKLKNKEIKLNSLKTKESNKKMKLPKLLSKSLKKINRFMEKDLALNNTRNHNVHLPGLTHLDANYSSAGDVSSTRFKSVTRAQWLGKENQKLSNRFSLDAYSKVLRSGFGFQFDYSHYGNGVIQDWNTSIIYSPKIAVSRSFLIEPAIRFKMGNKSLNASKVDPGQVEWDRNNLQDFYTTGSPVGNKLWYRDLGLSLLMHAKWLYIGVQADNLLRHVDNIYSNNIETPNKSAYHYTAYIGSDYDIPSVQMSFSPYFVYEKKGSREESWGGINMSLKKFTFGGAYSSNNNYAASVGFTFNRFAFTYQFDRTYSSLLLSKSSSHQLTLLINSKLSKSSRRYITL